MTDTLIDTLNTIISDLNNIDLRGPYITLTKDRDKVFTEQYKEYLISVLQQTSKLLIDKV